MEIKPFKAYRFDRKVVGDVGSCISPPYDVISDEEQQQLYEKSRYNIVRIIKGKTTASDDNSNNQYTRAADYFKSWIEQGVLKRDSAEAIYAYIHDFELAGEHYQRNSFIALAKLEEFGKAVRPHEQTLDKPRIDRLNLKRATMADLELVFMLYEDKNKIADTIIEKAAGQKPLIDFVDEQDVRHRLFAIASKKDIEQTARMMSDKSCIIADGHHRYETGLIYSKESTNPAAGYQTMAFCNFCQEGLVILATHRLVGNLENFNIKKLIDNLKENFEITRYPFDSDRSRDGARQKMLAQMKVEHNNDKNAFGIYGGNNTFYAAVLKDKRALYPDRANTSCACKSLDVTVLHKLILEKLLGIDEKKLASGGNIEYIKDTDDAIDESIAKVDKGQKQAAFFLNPVKIQQLRLVTKAGERMPQKSTYFYPKLYSGLTINKL
jgi:uncharacterized protein (DUF1015 family)